MSTAKREKIQQHYDEIADVYDLHYDHPRGRTYHTRISRHVMEALPRGGALLDIGCGTGLFVEKYLHHGGTATGIDLSRNMIERARRRCGCCDFVLATGESIPFGDNSFDAIASLLVFSYVRDPQAMLEEAYRVLRPGGAISICTLGKKLLTSGIPVIYKVSEKIRVRHVVMKDFGEHYYDENEMYELFSGAGFCDVKIGWCSFAHIDMGDPLFTIAQRVEPFIERRVPQLTYNICVDAKKPRT
ncbi:class I SAM-dependent methyltransferase [Methanoregula sp.]|uniref:class I SAM-dependent methyltransferase n=1 Tax=Methanoregula sp. TaxID=2052170 RepID=UPI002C19174D|nr:methyltransferase domain-containing protein [Methanoregula sp.]HVP97378.1 methyltransferase domain-containing protein [Methanoregula sp.]